MQINTLGCSIGWRSIQPALMRIHQNAGKLATWWLHDVVSDGKHSQGRRTDSYTAARADGWPGLVALRCPEGMGTSVLARCRCYEVA